jgi:hypothetical protein
MSGISVIVWKGWQVKVDENSTSYGACWGAPQQAWGWVIVALSARGHPSTSHNKETTAMKKITALALAAAASVAIIGTAPAQAGGYGYGYGYNNYYGYSYSYPTYYNYGYYSYYPKYYRKRYYNYSYGY